MDEVQQIRFAARHKAAEPQRKAPLDDYCSIALMQRGKYSGWYLLQVGARSCLFGKTTKTQSNASQTTRLSGIRNLVVVVASCKWAEMRPFTIPFFISPLQPVRIFQESHPKDFSSRLSPASSSSSSSSLVSCRLQMSLRFTSFHIPANQPMIENSFWMLVVFQWPTSQWLPKDPPVLAAPGISCFFYLLFTYQKPLPKNPPCFGIFGCSRYFILLFTYQKPTTRPPVAVKISPKSVGSLHFDSPDAQSGRSRMRLSSSGWRLWPVIQHRSWLNPPDVGARVSFISACPEPTSREQSLRRTSPALICSFFFMVANNIWKALKDM